MNSYASAKTLLLLPVLLLPVAHGAGGEPESDVLRAAAERATTATEESAVEAARAIVEAAAAELASRASPLRADSDPRAVTIAAAREAG